MNRLRFLPGIVVLFAATAARSDDVVINTPVVLGHLTGTWRLESQGKAVFKQELKLSGGQYGEWHQAREALPMTISWYVEGKELLILHYVEHGAFNYRMKSNRYVYDVEGDSLMLTRNGKKEIWKRDKGPQKRR